MGELPSQQRTRLATQYGLTAYDAEVLTAKGRPMVAYFEDVAGILKDGKAAANRLSDLVYPALTDRREELAEFPLSASAFAAFVTATAALPKQDRSEVFKAMLDKGLTLDEAKKLVGIQEFDDAVLRTAVRAAIAANPRAVADFKGCGD